MLSLAPTTVQKINDDNTHIDQKRSRQSRKCKINFYITSMNRVRNNFVWNLRDPNDIIIAFSLFPVASYVFKLSKLQLLYFRLLHYVYISYAHHKPLTFLSSILHKHDIYAQREFVTIGPVAKICTLLLFLL